MCKCVWGGDVGEERNKLFLKLKKKKLSVQEQHTNGRETSRWTCFLAGDSPARTGGGRGRMGSRGCLLSSLIAPALSDRPRQPSQGRRSQGRLGPKNTGAG